MRRNELKAVVAVGLVTFSFGIVANAVAADGNPLNPSYKSRLEMERDFKVIDVSKDDKIDMAEWTSHKNPTHPDFDAKHALPGTPRIADQEKLRAMFDEVDVNRDRIVDMAEWSSHSNPLHPDYEKNHPKPGTPKN